MLERQRRCSPAAPATFSDFGPVSVARPCTKFTLRIFAMVPMPPVSFSTTRVLVGAQLVDVDRRLAEGDAPLAGVPRLVDDLGDVQQRLRRDAAAVEADAAGILLFVDERDLHAEVGGVERGRVAAGARAEHSQLDGLRH